MLGTPNTSQMSTALMAVVAGIDGGTDVPTPLTLDLGFLTLRYVGGVFMVYVNEAGEIKSLSLGSPA